MPDNPTEPSPGTWSVPECPFTIEYSARVFDDIRLGVVDAFFSLPRGGAEIGGILLGRHTEHHVTIEDYRPLDCEHASGPSFVLSQRDEAKLTKLLEQSQTEVPGLSPVGWYHSHTRSEIFLSEADVSIHRRFFPEPWQIALVLKPHTFHPLRGGFFFHDPAGRMRTEGSYREFTVEALPLRPLPAAVPPRTAPTVVDITPEPPKAEAVLPEPAVQPAPEYPVALPPFVSALPPRRSWLWLKGVLALFAGLGVGAAGFQTRQIWLQKLPGVSRPGSDSAASLAITTADQNGQLQIRWDPSAPAVQRATTAVLSIGDGGPIAREVHLDTPRLRSGNFTYSRESDQVDVSLIIDQPDGPPVRAMSVFVGKAPPRPAAPAASPGDAKAGDAQITALQNELAAANDRIRKLTKSLADAQNELKQQQRKRMSNQATDAIK